MKAAVITFPGSNCDDDCIYALRGAEFTVDNLWHKDTPDLTVYDLVVLPGGFSYGDYLRCGAIASCSPIAESLHKYAAAGKLLLGICNGFQILCELRLVPGALAKNDHLKFVCRDVACKVETTSSPWTCEMKEGEVLSLPIAHGDGRFVVSDEEYTKLKANGQVLFSYVDNPNGSSHAIVGVCNEQKNVFGLMPHPERATDLRSRDGAKFWKSILRHLREKKA